MQIEFNELPREIKLEIIGTLQAYDECHIEHAYGKMRVATSYCLKGHYAEDEWISQAFTKENIGIAGLESQRNWNYWKEWDKATSRWEEKTNEEKEAIYNAFNELESRKEEEILEELERND